MTVIIQIRESYQYKEILKTNINKEDSEANMNSQKPQDLTMRTLAELPRKDFLVNGVKRYGGRYMIKLQRAY